MIQKFDVMRDAATFMMESMPPSFNDVLVFLTTIRIFILINVANVKKANLSCILLSYPPIAVQLTIFIISPMILLIQGSPASPSFSRGIWEISYFNQRSNKLPSYFTSHSPNYSKLLYSIKFLIYSNISLHHHGFIPVRLVTKDLHCS